MHWAFLLLWRVPQSLPLNNSPSMRLLPAHFTFGMVLCDEQNWFPSNRMLGIEVHLTRESYFSVWGSFRCFFANSKFVSCVFTEERIEFSTAIKPRSVECCSDVCPSVDFSHLYIWSWSSTRVTIRFLVTTQPKPFSMNCSVWPGGQL